MLKPLLLISLIFSGMNAFNKYIPSLATQVFPSNKQTLLRNNIVKKPLKKYPKINYAMSKIVITQPLTLQIWENNPEFPAPGTPPGINRPVGFASLSFTLENKTQQSVIVKLLTIQVRSVKSQKVLISMAATDLTLHALEIAPQRYQISNQEGYGNINQVEAVIIYELDGQRYTLQSPLVTIQKNP